MPAPLRILVAEDDENDILILKHAFRKAELPWAVNFVRDGQQLLDFLQRKPPFQNPTAYPAPNLLLLDLHLPRIDGFQALAWLRGQPRFSELAVIVLSGCNHPDDVKRAYTLGAAHYLVKRHDPRQLLEMLCDLERFAYRFVPKPAATALAAMSLEPQDGIEVA
ncbi:MAG TPA: response regulator [Candidatus Binatia bacterium]|jgi:two-component system response regulator|nr:response regulator [Candidatus Binatia bacterium]